MIVITRELLRSINDDQYYFDSLIDEKKYYLLKKASLSNKERGAFPTDESVDGEIRALNKCLHNINFHINNKIKYMKKFNIWNKKLKNKKKVHYSER